MPRPAVALILLLLTTESVAQLRVCRIVSAKTGVGLPHAVVASLTTGASWASDSAGVIRIPAADPGPFRISHISFQTRILSPDTVAGEWVVRLSPLAYTLGGVEVLSPLARYRRDSAFNHSFFRNQLADAAFRPEKKFVFIRTMRGIELGVQWGGMFSNLALLASGKKARYRRFARELRLAEANKFAAIRYTPGLVSELTGIEEDSAMAFISRHPLDEAFIRQASELEFRMRIRELYRSSR